MNTKINLTRLKKALEQKFPGERIKLKEDDMCLSNVYLNKKKEEKLLIEGASQVIADEQGVQINTLFGDSKRLENYFVREINLMDNYVILEKRKERS